jgi:hypothetical protein
MEVSFSKEPHSLSPTNLSVYNFVKSGGVNGYVLKSDKNGNATWGTTSSLVTGFTRTPGKLMQDGISIARWREDGIAKSLVVSYDYTESSGTIRKFAWSNITSTLVGTDAQSRSNGNLNSASIIAQASHTVSAAKKCLDITQVYINATSYYNVDDWFLPSIWQLSIMYNNSDLIKWSSINDTYYAYCVRYAYEYFEFDGYGYYWSSTEYDASNAWAIRMTDGACVVLPKSTLLKIRPFRIGTESQTFTGVINNS